MMNLLTAVAASGALFAYDAAADWKLRTRGVERRDGVTVVDLAFDGGSGSEVSAYLVVPAGAGPFAGVLWVHWLGEPATTNRTQYLAEAVALAPKGIASLLVDAMWSKPKWYEQRVPEEDFENSRKQVIALRRAFDVLQEQNVDTSRLGVVGHDYGGMYAMLMAGAEPRAKTYVYVATAPSLSHWSFFAAQPKSKSEYLCQNAVLELTDALRKVTNASTLFQFGTRDAYVSRADTAVLLAATQGRKERKFYEAEHDMALPQIAADRDAWLVQELAAKPASFRNAARSATRLTSSSEPRRDEPAAISSGNAPVRAPNTR
jgi:dienelactone hydrolase